MTARGTDGSSVPGRCWDEQDDYRDQTKHPAIARLGRFSTPLPSAPDGDSTEDAAAAQQHRVQADQLGVVKPLRPGLALGSLARICLARRGGARP